LLRSRLHSLPSVMPQNTPQPPITHRDCSNIFSANTSIFTTTAIDSMKACMYVRTRTYVLYGTGVRGAPGRHKTNESAQTDTCCCCCCCCCCCYCCWIFPTVAPLASCKPRGRNKKCHFQALNLAGT